MKTEQANLPKGEIKPFIPLLLWLTLCYIASFIGYRGAVQGLWFWYVAQLRPGWDPPTWSFTPVWTILYGMIGFATWLVIRETKGWGRFGAIALLIAFLGASASWPWTLFAFHRIPLSIGLSAGSALVLLASAVMFWRIRPTAARLLILPLLWVGYWTVVEYAVLRLNP